MVRQMKKSPDLYWTQLAQIRLIRLSDETEFDLRQFTSYIDWTNLFGNCNPVQIEVGCGKGRFLTESCNRNPDTNFIGIENSWKYVLRTKERLKKHNQNNACISYVDAPYFVRHYVADHSVEAYHVYFPDPWPKDKHQKRRIFNDPIWIPEIIRTLQPGLGCLFFATDFAEYFALIEQRLANWPQLIYQPEISEDPNYIQTSFEIKYRDQGRSIHRAVYKLTV